MKLVEDIRIRLAALGGRLDDVSDGCSLNLDAPAGYVWTARGEPNFRIQYATNSGSWLAKAVREERANLRMGLEKVTDPARLAEIRWNLGDDSWAAKPDAPDRLDWA